MASFHAACATTPAGCASHVRDRMVHARQVGAQVEDSFFILLAQGMSNVEKLSFRETNERPAEDRSEGEGVSAVRQRTYQGDEVLGLLSSIEVLARLRGNRQSFLLEGAFVSPELRPPRSQEGDVTWLSAGDLPAGATLQEAALAQRCANTDFNALAGRRAEQSAGRRAANSEGVMIWSPSSWSRAAAARRIA